MFGFKSFDNTDSRSDILRRITTMSTTHSITHIGTAVDDHPLRNTIIVSDDESDNDTYDNDNTDSPNDNNNTDSPDDNNNTDSPDDNNNTDSPDDITDCIAHEEQLPQIYTTTHCTCNDELIQLRDRVVHLEQQQERVKHLEQSQVLLTDCMRILKNQLKTAVLTSKQESHANSDIESLRECVDKLLGALGNK